MSERLEEPNESFASRLKRLRAENSDLPENLTDGCAEDEELMSHLNHFRTPGAWS